MGTEVVSGAERHPVHNSGRDTPGTQIFQLLEERAQEIVKRLNLLKEENTTLKTRNTAILDKQEIAHRKVRELLDRLNATSNKSRSKSQRDKWSAQLARLK